ncbi:MAG: ligase-associated DNA damage response exonuclease [bacterium]|nr:ligase-associated DNA damage response exonuclease [bacterium]
MADLIQITDKGFYCATGDFFIDPWSAVPRAVITHAHADHYAYGCEAYLVAAEGEPVFRARLGHDAVMQTVPYGEPVTLNGVTVSLHPAGHILGSAQVRVEYRGEVWVISGDYKTAPDVTCAPFELVRCHHFITEATFGLPIYRWQPQSEVFAEINAWWRQNQQDGKASVLYGYALGKAQRLIGNVDSSIGPIHTHGAVERLNRAYRESGVPLPPTQTVMQATTEGKKVDWSKALIVAPLSARGTTWTRRFGGQGGAHSSAFASGWMRIRGARRRRAVDRGFVLSDHVDWPSLMETVTATGAETIWVTHGYTAVVARWLSEQGLDARIVQTRYSGELEGSEAEAEETTLESTPEEG